jgi:hypothetical protein
MDVQDKKKFDWDKMLEQVYIKLLIKGGDKFITQ